MLPAFTPAGFLPAGFHKASWNTFVSQYGHNSRRQRLIESLHQILTLLSFADCSEVRIGGSFVTAKEMPGDFDGVWMTEGVDRDRLPMELDYSIAAQPEIFEGTLVPSDHQYTDIGMFVEVLHTNKNNEPVGVVVLNPREISPAKPWPRYVRFFNGID